MLKNKNILFSTDNIVGYKESVENALKRRFLEVEYIEEYLPIKEKRTLGFKILREISKNLNDKNIIKKLYKNLEKKNIREMLNKYKFKFDYFLVVAGREFSKEFLEILKEYNPKTKCILFLWDAFEETSLRKSSSEFDYIFSFDQKDCEKYGFIFRPIFYIEECEKDLIDYNKREYEIFYLGALRDKKRYDIVNEVYKYSNKNKLNYFLKIIYNKKNIKILKDNYNKEILSEKRVSYLENRKLLKNSRVVLDLNFEKQNGLTIRASEAIGSKNKIITTNKYIKEYDFYDEKNIVFIESIGEIKNISKEFFETEFNEISPEIKKRYTTEGFIEDIFNKIKK